MGTFTFEPSARLQRFLGKELIADPNVAIAEFVKNAYDAGASQVRVTFDLSAPDRRDHRITIADDGYGMDEDSFERNWMHPGYSEKAAGARTVGQPSSQNAARRRAAARTPIGEKGVGRLAAGRLGELAIVQSRMRTRADWLSVVFDWRTFDVMNRAMHDIPVPYDLVKQAHSDMPFSYGTLIDISELGLDWSGRLPGRKVSGRSDLRLGRLKEDLSVLVQPLGAEAPNFQVFLGIKSSDKQILPLAGVVSAGEPDWDAYRYDFFVFSRNGKVISESQVRRSVDVAKELGLPTEDTPATETISGASTPGFQDEERPATLACGEFSGHFLFSTVPWKRSSKAGIPPGVRLYRDGIRVPPYGDVEDDWVGARARKASRQGYALQPESIWGVVHIAKEKNPNLTDMSNRDGLVQNEEHDEFLQHVHAEFRAFLETVEREWLSRSWATHARARATSVAESNANYQAAMAQLYVHRLRGPLGATRVSVQSALDRAEQIARGIADEDIGRVVQHLKRAEENIEALDGALEELIELAGKPAEPEEFELRKAVEDALVHARGAFTSRGIVVDASIASRRRVVLPYRVVRDAIEVVLTNAAEVARPAERMPGRITVNLVEGGRGFRVEVRDDGTGVAPDRREDLFTALRVEKGHVGRGLATARTTLRLYGGDLECVESGVGGSLFSLDLPTMALQRDQVKGNG